MNAWRLTRIFAAAAASLAAAACAQQPRTASLAVQPVSYTSADRECMARAMYFESHRGADEGMVAVGTVVANRKDSGRYGATICDVVGQKRQFAAGVMTRTMDGDAAERARRNADKVLSGNRHPALKGAMFFHTAGLKFRYPNMHYVLVAGGNAFYEKRSVVTAQDARENARSKALALAYARIDPTGAAKAIMVATADRAPAETPERAAAPQLASIAPVAAERRPAAEPAAVASASAAPARTSPKLPAPAPLAFASAAETPTIERTLAPKKRVLRPSQLAPALASAIPAAPQPAAEAAQQSEPSRSYAYNDEVAAAFAAFDAR